MKEKLAIDSKGFMFTYEKEISKQVHMMADNFDMFMQTKTNVCIYTYAPKVSTTPRAS